VPGVRLKENREQLIQSIIICRHSFSFSLTRQELSPAARISAKIPIAQKEPGIQFITSHRAHRAKK
jgi:hypothetical protein